LFPQIRHKAPTPINEPNLANLIQSIWSSWRFNWAASNKTMLNQQAKCKYPIISQALIASNVPGETFSLHSR